MERTIQLGGVGDLIWLIVVLLAFLVAAAAVALIVFMDVRPEVRKWAKDPNRTAKGLLSRLFSNGVAIPFWLVLIGIGIFTWSLCGKVHKVHVSEQGDIVCTNVVGIPVRRIDGTESRTANWFYVTRQNWDDTYQRYQDEHIFYFVLQSEQGKELKFSTSSGKRLRDALGYQNDAFLSGCTNRQASSGSEVMTLPHTFAESGPICPPTEL